MVSVAVGVAEKGADRGPLGSVECASLSDAQSVSGRRIATQSQKEDIHVRPKEVEEVTNHLKRVERGEKRS